MKTPPTQGEIPPRPAALLVDIEAPFLDVHADDLRWALNLPAQEALATEQHQPHTPTTSTVVDSPVGSGGEELSGFLAETRILGASHQVLIQTAAAATRSASGALFTETVACGLHDTTALPRTHLYDNPHTSATAADTSGDWWWRCALRSRIAHLKPRPFAAAVNALAVPIPDTTALVAQSPGHPDAVTGIRLHTSLLTTGRVPTVHSEPSEGRPKHQHAHHHDAPWVIAWTTWHAYPQAGQLVTTHTLLHLTTPAT